MWNPWVGKNYKSGRILILGESSYAWREHTNATLHEPSADHPIHMVNGQLESEQDDSRFMTMLTNALTNNDSNTVDKRRAGWDRVAFTNYVPVSVGIAARQRPDHPAWTLAKAEWPDLLEALAPRHIVVLGLQTWDQIPKGAKITESRYVGPDRDPLIEAFFLKNGHETLAWCHWHPTAGASWKSISDLLALIEVAY